MSNLEHHFSSTPAWRKQQQISIRNLTPPNLWATKDISIYYLVWSNHFDLTWSHTTCSARFSAIENHKGRISWAISIHAPFLAFFKFISTTLQYTFFHFFFKQFHKQKQSMTVSPTLKFRVGFICPSAVSELKLKGDPWLFLLFKLQNHLKNVWLNRHLSNYLALKGYHIHI